MYLIYCR